VSVSCSAVSGASAGSGSGGGGDGDKGRIMKGEVRAPRSNCSIWSNRALTSARNGVNTPCISASSVRIPSTAPSSLSKRSLARVVGVGAAGGASASGAAGCASGGASGSAYVSVASRVT